jgi:Polyketide cyclase / dehydrase and lipid transport
MSFYTCPIATVHAPLDKVWCLLSDPSRYALWWDAETRSISPKGPAIAGQEILARTKALGMEWDVHILVEHVDETRHTLQLTTALPLGITVHNHITCTSLDEASCRVTFG